MGNNRPTYSNSALEEAIAKFPSLAAMARELKLSGYQVIQDWRRRGCVPAEHCPEIEKATNVRCEGLNSKVAWAYLRETKLVPAEELQSSPNGLGLLPHDSAATE